MRARRGAGVLRCGQRRGRGALRRDRAERRPSQRRRWADLERAHGLARAPFAADVELSPEAVDVARPLDRPRSARRGRAPRRDRAGRIDALDRPRRDLAGPPARRPPGRPFPHLASARSGSRVRGRRRGRRVERRRGRYLEVERRGAEAPLHVVRDRGPRGPGPLVRLGEHGAVRRARRRRSTGVRVPTSERRLGALAGLPEPLPSMPYALVATEDRLFAGLAGGELWESRDRGDTWRRCTLLGNGLTRLLALVSAPR